MDLLFAQEHAISFNDRHSFRSKGEVLDQLLHKISVAELKLPGTEDLSAEESLVKARELLSRKGGARFVSHDPELPIHLRAEYTSVGYHFEENDRDKAASRAEYILSRMTIEEDEAMMSHVPIVKTWIKYILSQSHVVAGTWFWSCRHRSLDFQGVEGKGVMISTPDAEGEEMEICWMRLTASRI